MPAPLQPAELPAFLSVEAAAAVAIAINGSGAVSASTTKLLTVDQVDEALRRSVDYTPPGG